MKGEAYNASLEAGTDAKFRSLLVEQMHNAALEKRQDTILKLTIAENWEKLGIDKETAAIYA